MTGPTKLRIRGRRATQGTILEWHPEDKEQAEEIIDNHALAVATIYDLIDRRHVANGDIVAEILVWEKSGTIEDIDIPDKFLRHRSRAILEDVRANVESYTRGVA